MAAGPRGNHHILHGDATCYLWRERWTDADGGGEGQEEEEEERRDAGRLRGGGGGEGIH